MRWLHRLLAARQRRRAALLARRAERVVRAAREAEAAYLRHLARAGGATHPRAGRPDR